MENYLRFEFPQAAGAAQEELLAELAEWPFEGFEEQDNALVAYIPENACDEALREYLNALATEKGWTEWKETLIPPQNWNAEWEKNYDPVIVGKFCVIRATFHEPIAGVEHDIVITPKMSFGTGHHATTFMVSEAMSEVNFKDKTVLDYGCGTSILAILAAKLGAKKVVAIDNDPWAYENSIENCAINGVSEKIELYEGDWSILPKGAVYDIILANINRHIILGSMADMAAALTTGGILLCSGFLAADVELVTEAAARSGMKLVLVKEQEQWRCLKFEK